MCGEFGILLGVKIHDNLGDMGVEVKGLLFEKRYCNEMSAAGKEVDDKEYETACYFKIPVDVLLASDIRCNGSRRK